MKFILGLLSCFCILENALAHSASEGTKSALRQLKSNPLVGIEVLIAGESFQSPASAFGHSMIRFVSDSSDPYNDIIVSFIADGSNVDEAYLKNLSGSKLHQSVQSTTGLMKYMAKGLFGSYVVGIDAAPLKEILERYAGDDGRSLKRIIVPTTVEQRNKIVEGVFRLGVDGSRPYYFHAFNCAVAILRVLQFGGLPYFPWSTTNKPVELEGSLNRNLWVPYPNVEMINMPAVAKKIYDNLNVKADNEPITKPTNEEVLTAALKLDKLSLLRLYLLRSHRLPTSTARALAAAIRARPEQFNLEQIYGTRIFDPSVYELNESNQTQTLHRDFASEKDTYCPKMGAVIRYREAFPLTEATAKTFDSYKNTHRSFCRK